MVSILPAKRSPWTGIAEAMSEFGRNAPQLMEERFKTQRGLSALEKAEQALAAGQVNPATGEQRNLNPYEIAMQFAKAGAANPGLERALGPLMQTAMQEATVNRAFPQAPGAGQPQQPTQIPSQVSGNQPQQQIQEPFKGALPSGQPSGFATPSPFNIMTPDEIVSEGQRYAQAVRDPNAAAMREQQLRNQNETASIQRQDLENMAIKSNVKPDELPRFMQVGQKFDTRNPSEWFQNTKRAFDKVKSNDNKIQRQFVPGIGQALMGQDRSAALKRLVPVSQEQKSLGLEEDTRKYYADQYMSPTEIEEQFNPLTADKEKAIKSIPNGSFPREAERFTIQGMGAPPVRKGQREMSYEEALEKNPEKLQEEQERLSDFFLNNVDDNTSLLVLEEKLWKDKAYDWRQFGPAIREAQKKGLILNDRQSTEMADVESNPPMQSLPDIFRDLSRIPAYLRGNK